VIQISTQALSGVIGGIFVVLALGLFFAKSAMESKWKTKIVGIFWTPPHKAKVFLCKNLQPGSVAPQIEPPKGYGQYIIQEHTHFTIQYPVGLPSFLQVTLTGYWYTTDNAYPINPWGKQDKLNPLALQAIKNEKVTETVIATANDISNKLEEFLAKVKILAGGKMMTYILIGLAVAAAGYGAYLTYLTNAGLKASGFIP
jgi:hypothetical protein